MRDLEKKKRRLREKARECLPGFPVESPFNTIEEVREYIGGSTIKCLICGRSFKKISGRHLHIHGITSDEYKEKYNIPWTYPLSSAPTFLKFRERGLQLYARFGKRLTLDEFVEKVVRRPKRKRPFCPNNYKAKQGESNGRSKLTNDQVLEIKVSKLGCDLLSRQFGVSRTVIKRIRSGRLWRHLACANNNNK